MVPVNASVPSPLPHPVIETFVPLYLTNTCHGACRMCSMRVDNVRLRRISPDLTKVREQLSIIRDVEGILAVCLLTGEYRVSSRMRRDAFDALLASVRMAFSMGFGKVYLGFGSFTDEEIAQLSEIFPSHPNLVLSLFQETYDRDTFRHLFGGSNGTPKADFDVRRGTPMRWIKAGFTAVDLGVLLGLASPEQEIHSLLSHARELRSVGADVSVSLPRIIGKNRSKVVIDAEGYARIARHVSEALPDAKVVLTTRESLDTLRSLLPWVGIVSPGSSDVMPYTWAGKIPNSEQTSQFQVKPWRPRPSWVLNQLGLPEGAIKYFESRREKGE